MNHTPDEHPHPRHRATHTPRWTIPLGTHLHPKHTPTLQVCPHTPGTPRVVLKTFMGPAARRLGGSPCRAVSPVPYLLQPVPVPPASPGPGLPVGTRGDHRRLGPPFTLLSTHFKRRWPPWQPWNQTDSDMHPAECPRSGDCVKSTQVAWGTLAASQMVQWPLSPVSWHSQRAGLHF